jgi:hypothetical protein
VELFRYATSVYGDKEIIGASFDLLQYFVAAGAAIIVAHAIFKWVVPSHKNAVR